MGNTWPCGTSEVVSTLQTLLPWETLVWIVSAPAWGGDAKGQQQQL